MEKTPQTDEALLELYKTTSDQQPLAELYLRYTHLVYGTALKYLRNAEDSKDAVMNIYQELVVKLLNHEVASFRSWLYVLTKNHCLMLLRKQKRLPLIQDESALMHFEDFPHLDNIQAKEKQFQSLEHCLERLPAAQKKCIELFYLQQRCYHDIVQETGMEWNKIRSMIQNGRRNLQNCMDEHEG